MADLKPRLHLLAYDIADPRRLGRVHRHMRRRGIPVQYSVFVVNLNKPGLMALMAELRELFDPQEDDIRIYPLPGRPEVKHLGRQLLPEGVMLLGDGIDPAAIPGLHS